MAYTIMVMYQTNLKPAQNMINDNNSKKECGKN